MRLIGLPWPCLKPCILSRPNQIATHEKGRPFQDALLLAHWAAQSYNGEQCVDLYDFCNLLQKRVREDRREESVWSCCKRIMEFLTEGDDRIIKRSCYAGEAFQIPTESQFLFRGGITT